MFILNGIGHVIWCIRFLMLFLFIIILYSQNRVLNMLKNVDFYILKNRTAFVTSESIPCSGWQSFEAKGQILLLIESRGPENCFFNYCA